MGVIWWIRRDVRMGDNRALEAARQAAGDGFLQPLFILDPGLLNSPYHSPRRAAFLFAGLRELDARLQALGSRLLVRRGNPGDVLPALCVEANASAVLAERDYSPYARRRDTALLADARVPLTLVEGAAIRPVESVSKKDGSPYVVFTPYSRRWREQPRITPADLLPPPTSLPPALELAGVPLPFPDDQPENAPIRPGEAEADARLRAFTAGPDAPIYAYATARDRPDLDGTSQLSPYLRLGMVSSRTAAAAAYLALENTSTQAQREGAATWLSELIWRDFYMTILYHFPRVRSRNFRHEYDDVAWRNDPDDFVAWCAGRTGYPFIDAAMRQLKASGWMHNRARMAVASFLVKDLLIDWRWGERWFMQQLIDGDPAANNGGWQWSAGTGTDAAPYFRIFNPVSQGEKHDPDGAYVRRWVPELSNVPDKVIHTPWKLSEAEQKHVGCILGRDYPLRMVDHKAARERTLDAYRAARGGK